ncbi:MAG: hypothetical protein WC551_08695 [Patescibacteria group bacterium]
MKTKKQITDIMTETLARCNVDLAQDELLDVKLVITDSENAADVGNIIFVEHKDGICMLVRGQSESIRGYGAFGTSFYGRWPIDYLQAKGVFTTAEALLAYDMVRDFDRKREVADNLASLEISAAQLGYRLVKE